MNDIELSDFRAKLLGSPLLFTQVFFKKITGKDFVLPTPAGRECHFITIFRELKKVFDGKIQKLMICMPPRYGKTTSLVYFAAWTMAHYGDCNNLYVSCEKGLATAQTQAIRDIIDYPLYKQLFDREITEDTRAKHNFHTTDGGTVYACGAGGTIIGRGAGIYNCPRYGGAIYLDDIIDANDVLSETIRGDRIDWYARSLEGRVNHPPVTAQIAIGQRLHEDDPLANLKKKGGWTVLSIPALDGHNNALDPGKHTTQALLKMKEEEPYVFASQFQQEPQPAGGAIFKPEWFVLMDSEPQILETFITADTAETDKNYNDATVFSFWGIYKIRQSRNPFALSTGTQSSDIETDIYGLHWIDCVELRVEPKDLHNEFINFYANCMRHKVKPNIAYIEKKSTGVTLVSILSGMQGLQIIDMERTRASGSKIQRFLETQPFISSKRVSLPRNGKHTQMCIDHCKKIAANNSHRFDDIADNLADAVRVSFIDEIVLRRTSHTKNKADDIVNMLAQNYKNQQRIWGKQYDRAR